MGYGGQLATYEPEGHHGPNGFYYYYYYVNMISVKQGVAQLSCNFPNVVLKTEM